MRIQKLSTNQCCECKTPFQCFADRHIMRRNGISSQDVCGVCAKRLITQGWKLTASFYNFVYVGY
jgi:hypothetical protein